MRIDPYLNCGGNCEEAFKFYEKHLGGTDLWMMKFREMPDAEKHCPPGFEDKVLHARIKIGETSVLASDVPGFQPMRSNYLCLAVDSNEEAERIYGVLVEGGDVFMKLGETFFAHRFGQLRDKFGTLWMIIHTRGMAEA